MRLMDMKLWLTTILASVVLLGASSVHAVTPTSWKDTGLSINANGMTLHEVFQEFSRTYSVRLSIGIRDDQVVKARLKADSGSEFLDRLTQAYKFRWFVYNDTLYIVPRDDNASVRLEVGEDAVQDAKNALTGLGLFESRFGWGELPDEGVVIVSGPRAYVDLVRAVLLPADEKAKLKGRQMMVFRLKYASATDRTINTRGQSTTIPGVKTVLTGLLGNLAEKGTDSSQTKFDGASSKRSRQPKSGKGGAQEIGTRNSSFMGTRAQADSSDEEDRSSSRNSKEKTPTKEDPPRIEADPSLNAIIVYDKASKREMYENVIKELDIEPQQVEIEALIVDIDRSKLAEMGIEWSTKSGNTVGTFNSTTADSQGANLPLPGATLLISNAANFYARLKALEGSGQAHVLAKPTVLTLDNVAAVLDLSQTAYVQLVGERVADLADVTAGTMLRVVPRIVHDGKTTKVRLEVDIEDGSLDDASLKTSVTRSTISTQAIVDVQQTLMIGGYHAESVKNNSQKVPVLGDVPLFGNLFRSNSESHTTRERLFLITPRLSGTTGTPAPDRSKASFIGQKVIKKDNLKFIQQLENKSESAEVFKDTYVAPVAEIPKAPVPPAAPAPAPISVPTAAATSAYIPAPVVAVPVSSPSSVQVTPLPPQDFKRISYISPAVTILSKRSCARPKGTPIAPLPSPL